MAFGKYYDPAKANLTEATEAATEAREAAEAGQAAAEAVHADTSLMAQLVEKLVAAATANAITPAMLKQIISEAGTTSAEAMRASLKPENPDHQHISAYFTLADKTTYGDWTLKPKLDRKTFFVGTEEKEDRLTCAEIEAYNRLGTYAALHGHKVEARGGKWTAEIKKNGVAEELWIVVPCETIDQRMNMAPSLLLTLVELCGGPSTDNIPQLLKQIELLTAREVKHGVDPIELQKELAAL